MLPVSLPKYQLADQCLKDKIILLTGATRGLGREVALKVAEYGATTILIGSKVKNLEKVFDDISDRNFPEPALQPMNFLGVGPREMDTLKQSVESMFGRLDGIVHCAANVGQVCPLENLPPEKWLQSIHVNLNIPFLLTHAMLPLLHKSEHASVIFTADTETSENKAYWGAYNASKAGLTSLADTIAQELENTVIKINSVYPPNLRTALKVNHYPGVDQNEFVPAQLVATDFVYLLSQQNTAHGQHFRLIPEESYA